MRKKGIIHARFSMRIQFFGFDCFMGIQHAHIISYLYINKDLAIFLTETEA